MDIHIEKENKQLTRAFIISSGLGINYSIEETCFHKLKSWYAKIQEKNNG